MVINLTGRNGLHIAGTRNFSRCHRLNGCNPENGRQLDNTNDVVNYCKKNESDIREYFDTKEESIVRDSVKDDNTKVVSKMVGELHAQRNEVLELSDLPMDSESSSESDSEVSDSENLTDQDNNKKVKDFKQDSSDLVETEFSSFEPFED